jgi:hypothetical protein
MQGPIRAPIGALCNPIGKWQMHVYMAPIGALCNPIGRNKKVQLVPVSMHYATQ